MAAAFVPWAFVKGWVVQSVSVQLLQCFQNHHQKAHCPILHLIHKRNWCSVERSLKQESSRSTDPVTTMMPSKVTMVLPSKAVLLLLACVCSGISGKVALQHFSSLIPARLCGDQHPDNRGTGHGDACICLHPQSLGLTPKTSTLY